jgi:hypothetical protein
MSLPIEKKRLMLGGALMLTLGLSAWLALGMDKVEEGTDVVEAAKPVTAKQNAATRRAERSLSLPILATVRANGQIERHAADIFKSHAWFVPPPRVVKAVVAPTPPPPLPFTYLGSLQDHGHKIVFLSRDQHLFTVRKGEVFDSQYRLEDENGSSIELMYLPLNAKQTLVIKGAS